LFVYEAQDFFRVNFRRVGMYSDRDPDQFALAEGRHHTTAGLNAMTQGYGHPVGEELIQGDRKAHVAMGR
jgi:hypothetical protein